MSEKESDKTFICYLDDDGKKVKGYFNILEDNNPNYVKFTSGDNVMKIPYSRILKIKHKKSVIEGKDH